MKINVFLILIFSYFFNISVVYGDNLLSQKNQQLKGVNTQINTLKKNLQMTEKQRKELQQMLKSTEYQIVKMTAELEAFDQQMLEKQKILLASQEERNKLEENLEKEQQLFAQQLRASYQLGEYEYFQLLLNQENPSTVLRLATYTQYIHKARVKTLLEIQKTKIAIQKKQNIYEKEIQSLRELAHKDQEKKLILQQNQQKRLQIIKELNQKIQTQSSQLKEYEKDRQELESLVKHLEKMAIKAISIKATKTPPVSVHPVSVHQNSGGNSLGQGHHFIWPTQGKLLNRASVPALKNEMGIVILAPEGQKVVAVYPGKVVFSDWLKGFGLLIIIDHGHGFMTLYAYNQTLYQKRGNFVKTGDMIATVGHTGILSESGLYFEVRRNGKPLNPLQWLS